MQGNRAYAIYQSFVYILLLACQVAALFAFESLGATLGTLKSLRLGALILSMILIVGVPITVASIGHIKSGRSSFLLSCSAANIISLTIVFMLLVHVTAV